MYSFFSHLANFTQNSTYISSPVKKMDHVSPCPSFPQVHQVDSSTESSAKRKLTSSIAWCPRKWNRREPPQICFFLKLGNHKGRWIPWPRNDIRLTTKSVPFFCADIPESLKTSSLPRCKKDMGMGRNLYNYIFSRIKIKRPSVFSIPVCLLQRGTPWWSVPWPKLILLILVSSKPTCLLLEYWIKVI